MKQLQSVIALWTMCCVARPEAAPVLCAGQDLAAAKIAQSYATATLKGAGNLLNGNDPKKTALLVIAPLQR